MTNNPPAKSFTDQPQISKLRIAAADPPRRSRSKIALLAKEHRDAINKLLLDGSSYAAVISLMAEQGISLNSQNVSKWYQSGFQEYLAHLERLDHQRAKYQAAAGLMLNMDVSKLPEADLQTAAAQIYDLLDRFTPADIAGSLVEEPDRYIRMVNSLSRLTHEALQIQKYTDARAQTTLRRHDPNRELDQRESRAMVRSVEKLFGIASATGREATGAD
jgi:hypothetical protein